MISDDEIYKYINSDIPLDDITTSLCKNRHKNAKLKIITREDIILSGSNIAKRVAKALDCKVINTPKDGTFINAGESIFNAEATFENLHKAWKLIQILFEYSCKISTYTANMVKQAQSINPKCQIQTTRKSFPFAKEFCLNAVLAGGGRIHRANLSDSILFFANHIKIYENFELFCKNIKEFKIAMPEKKIMVECENLNDFKILLHYEPDVIQCDKMSVNELKTAIQMRGKNAKNIIITAAGGINLKNCAEFAATGVDALITSAPYTQGTADITGKIFI